MFSLEVITSTRADYGLLRPVLQKLYKSPIVEPRLLVTGAHLSGQYGFTVSEIEADNFPIQTRLDILSTPVPPGRAGTAWRTALALDAFLGHFSSVSPPPDAVLLLGDRYEMFAAAQAAALLDIPVLHISGGDVTHGADDDWFRHCITKMSKLHFCSCQAYRQRVIRMGEAPNTVFNVGGLGDENIRNTPLLSWEQLAASLEEPVTRPFALVTFHPETATTVSPRQQVAEFLTAVRENPNLFYLFTMANADAGGQEMNDRVQEYCQNHTNAALFASLGSLRYLSALSHAALVLGNSSSGMVETPSLGTPTVNIGQRQAGRITGSNVLHCEMSAPAISAAIRKALTPAFTQKARAAQSPYNGGNTSGKIVQAIEQALEQNTLQGPKIFYDGEAAQRHSGEQT